MTIITDLSSFHVDEVLFFGRSVNEYRSMFNLDYDKLQGARLLDCSSGPAALAATGPSWGIDVVACDPLYQLPLNELRQLIDDHVDIVSALQSQTQHLFEDALRKAELRKQDMGIFLADYESGKQSGRYVAGALPNLPFADNSFDISLCGNFLFLYSDTECGGMMRNSPFDYDFHLHSLRELCRVTAGESRIYPLHGPHVSQQQYLNEICTQLKDEGIRCDLVPVSSSDIKTATHLLRISRA